MPCLFVIAGPDEGTVHQLHGEPTTIGRGDAATLQLVDERASRVHCGLTPRQETAGDFGVPVTRWVLEDKGSSNGTRIGQEKIDGEVILQDGDVIGLGRTNVAYLSDSCTDTEQARARCTELGIDAGTLSEAAWPMENPAARGTLHED
ncbi:MAG: FHA domain-containing protein [Phycisphaerales bacterium]|nr:FHA domain-containing protein [Phycisphaerales bacterium]